MNDTPGRMLSSLTGGDKQHPKLGGCVGVFFQLFDWNRRLTGKKLFSNRLLPAERPKQISKKYSDEKLPMAKLLLIADENRGGFPNTKKSSGSVCSSTEEFCCSSSEEGNESSARAPGVVARLMGLDSLPAKDLLEYDECRIFSEKKGFSRNVKGMVPNGKESSGNRSKRESLKYAETYGEGNKKGQWNARQDSQSCSKSMDVVSFTFSSPMRSTGGSQTGIHMMEKKQGQGQELDDWRERQNACWRDPPGDSEPEKIISEVTCTSSASSKPSISEGDSLNALLEQKLRELTSGGGRDLGTGNSSKDSIAGKTTASILQDLILTLNTGRPVQIDQEINHSTGPSHSDKARQSDLTSEDCLLEYSQTFGENTKFQLGDMVCNFADNGQPRGFSGSGYVPSRGSTVLTDMEDPGGASGQVCSEDCDQPSPVSILEASFSNESCNSSESLDSARDDKLRLLRSSVQNRAGRACPVDERQGQGLDVDAELSDSATSANFELVESDKIMDAILDISRMHKIDPSSIGLAETQPVCLEDQELEYVREIVCNADLLSQDAALLDEDEIADFLVDPHLFDRLEAEEASTDDYSLHRLKNSCYNLGFRKAQGSWQNRKLLFDCVKDCLSLKYNSRYRGGYRTWVKGPTCVVKEQLAREVYEEMDEIVEKDMSTPMGKWTDFETEMFEIGVEIEKNIFRVLVEEVVHDLLTDTSFT